MPVLPPSPAHPEPRAGVDGVRDELTPGDWGFVMERFVADLKTLGEHIAEHDIIENAQTKAADIRHALHLWDEYQMWANGDAPAATALLHAEREDLAWSAFWDFVGNNIRGWWD